MLWYDLINGFINILEILSYKLQSQVTIYKEEKKKSLAHIILWNRCISPNQAPSSSPLFTEVKFFKNEHFLCIYVGSLHNIPIFSIQIDIYSKQYLWRKKIYVI